MNIEQITDIQNLNFETLKVSYVDTKGSFGCQRPVGSGFYDRKVSKTFVTWNGPEMDIYVKHYNHTTKQWGASIQVFKNHMTGRWDYHNYPAMIQAPNGKALIFYAYHTTKLYLLEAPEKSTIEGTWLRKSVSEDRNCYPAPVVVGNTIYVFYSRNTEASYPYRTYCYIKSTDSGESWSDPQVIIDSEKKDPYKYDEVYAFGTKYVQKKTGKTDKIMITWSMWGGPYGHARQGKGCYFAYFCTTCEHMYSADDTDLGITIYYEDMINKCFIETATPTDEVTHVVECPIATYGKLTGLPVVAYGYRNPQMNIHGITRIAKWVGSTWEISTLDNETYDVKDIENDPEDGGIRLAYNKGNYLIIKKTFDDGKIWFTEYMTKIPYNGGSNFAPYTNFINQHKGEVQLLMGQINSEEACTDYTGKWAILAIGQA